MPTLGATRGGRLGAAPRGAPRLRRLLGKSSSSLPAGTRRAAQRGARSLRLPHSPGAATAAAGLGLLPPPSLRSPTPEALGEGRGARRAQAAGGASATASAASSGRESCQGRAVPSGAPWARSAARSALEAPPSARPLAESSRAALTCRRAPAAPRWLRSPARQAWESGDNYSFFGLCPKASCSHRPARQGSPVCLHCGTEP